MSFKVGDIVTGTEDNNYGYTNKDALMVVTGVTRNIISVKILEHLKYPGMDAMGNFDSLHADKFKKWEDK